jgi:hypothetical protein
LLRPRNTRKYALRKETRHSARGDVHVTPRGLVLGVMHARVHVVRHCAIAARRVGVEPPACVHGAVRRLLDRRDGASAGRREDARPLATDPGNTRRSVVVVMPPARLALERAAVTLRTGKERVGLLALP